MIEGALGTDDQPRGRPPTFPGAGPRLPPAVAAQIRQDVSACAVANSRRAGCARGSCADIWRRRPDRRNHNRLRGFLRELPVHQLRPSRQVLGADATRLICRMSIVMPPRIAHVALGRRAGEGGRSAPPSSRAQCRLLGRGGKQTIRRRGAIGSPWLCAARPASPRACEQLLQLGDRGGRGVVRQSAASAQSRCPRSS